MKTINKHGMELVSSRWNGRIFVEMYKYNGKLFRIITGLENGGGENCVYVWTEHGWKFLMGKYDVEMPLPYKDTSYVSSELERQRYAEKLNQLYRDIIVELF